MPSLEVCLADLSARIVQRSAHQHAGCRHLELNVNEAVSQMIQLLSTSKKPHMGPSTLARWLPGHLLYLWASTMPRPELVTSRRERERESTKLFMTPDAGCLCVSQHLPTTHLHMRPDATTWDRFEPRVSKFLFAQICKGRHKPIYQIGCNQLVR